jgi:acyl-CoA synthetase (NDP forming)
MLATASADDYRRALPLVLADPAVDSVIVIFIPPLSTDASDVAQAIVESTKGANKPVIATFLSAKGAPRALAPIPCYTFPEASARALAKAVEYGRWRSQPPGHVAVFADACRDSARAIVDRALAAGGGWLETADVTALLAAFGIDVVASSAVLSEDGAVDAARRAGYPVVLKAVGPTLLHKTEANAVALGLGTDSSVRAAYADFRARLGDAMSAAVVQPMIERGVEMFVGATLDPTFGHVILCGTGGTAVELVKDIACGLHPLTDTSAREMLGSLKGIELLRGFRGAPHADERALHETMLRVSALLDACPEILEMDLNPVMVLASGVRIVDARVRVGRDTPPPRQRRVEY